jgi:murein DD-endopeptidase MepM/ murein hydrolase activator NlpD
VNAFAARVLGALALWAGLSSASAAPAPDVLPPPTCFPLENVRSTADLRARLMCPWLAGLPGNRRYNGTHIHAGVDLRASLGEACYAVVDGVVDPLSDTLHSGYGPGWTQGGVMVVRSTLADGSPFLTLYGHTQNHRVHGGEAVRAGQMLGEIGPWLAAEGGPHLHLTVRMGDLPRFGWGTPTLQGNPVREGAEAAGCEAEVVRLGYRNPLLVLWGIL